MPRDLALVKRGLLLLGLISCIALALVVILFERPTAQAPPLAIRPEPHLADLISPVNSFPASVSWANAVQAYQALPSAPGWEVRYNAARTLALRGSDQVPWPIFLEMLDERQQMCNYRVKLQDGRVASDESAARQNMLIALRALAEWHKKHPKSEVSAELARVYASVDGLAESPILEIKTQADKTRKTFFR